MDCEQLNKGMKSEHFVPSSTFYVVDRSHYSCTYKCLIKTFLLCQTHGFLADFFIRGMSFTLYNNARVSHKISFMDSFCNYWLEVSCWTVGRLFICVSCTQQLN